MCSPSSLVTGARQRVGGRPSQVYIVVAGVRGRHGLPGLTLEPPEVPEEGFAHRPATFLRQMPRQRLKGLRTAVSRRPNCRLSHQRRRIRETADSQLESRTAHPTCGQHHVLPHPSVAVAHVSDEQRQSSRIDIGCQYAGRLGPNRCELVLLHHHCLRNRKEPAIKCAPQESLA